MTPESFWHLRDARDWRQMVQMGYKSAYTLESTCVQAGAPADDGPTPQTLVINYDNEFRESAITDCVTRNRDGSVQFPYRFGCSLLKVVRQEDRNR